MIDPHFTGIRNNCTPIVEKEEGDLMVSIWAEALVEAHCVLRVT